MSDIKAEVGMIVAWFVNPQQYIKGKIVEIADNDSVWVEHSNGQQRLYKLTELSVIDS